MSVCRLRFWAASSFALFILPTLALGAPEVGDIRQGQVLIESPPSSFIVGTEIKTFDAAGYTDSEMTIIKIQNGKAVAGIDSGRPKKGDRIYLATDPSPGQRQKLMLDIGFLAGGTRVTQDVKLDPTTINMAGYGYAVGGITDIKFSNRQSARIGLGFEDMQTAGSTSGAYCDNSSSNKCKTGIGFITFDAWYRVRLAWDFWAGFGLGYRHPVYKHSTALVPSSIIPTVSALFGGGWDIPFDGFKLPIQIDTGTFVPPLFVETKVIAIRAGLKFPIN